MKKVLFLFTAFVLAFTLSGCNGDGSAEGDWTPGTYYGIDSVGQYLAIVDINEEGGIENVYFDAIYGESTKQVLGFDYGMVSRAGADYEWFEHANMLSDYIVENQGWGDITLDETTIEDDWNAITVPNHFITIDIENSPDAVSGVTVGVEGFVIAWNDAISQASDSDLGVVDLENDVADWAVAHEPPFQYEDGVYYGFDNGQSALITIEGGLIVDVYLNAVHTAYGSDDFLNMKRDYTLLAEYDMHGACDDNGTPDDPTDDICDQPDDKLTWWEQADALEDAIVDAQTWAWTLDTEDKIDGIAGVSITVAGWEVAVNEALAKAAPTE